jgi:hypothetical protein
MSLDVYEKEFAKKQTLDLIHESLKDLHDEDKKIEGHLFLNEMKSKYGK